MKGIIWIVSGILAIFSFFYVLRTTEGEESQDKKLIPRFASSYALYVQDPTMDSYGRARFYQCSDINSEWVNLTCEEKVGALSMLTGDTFKGRIGFNPRTLDGVWRVEYPNRGIIQTGTILLVPNSRGGYLVMFKYDDGNSPSKATLVANW